MRRQLGFFLVASMVVGAAFAGAPSGPSTYYPENITCASVNSVQKCAKLPHNGVYNQHIFGLYSSILDGMAINDTNWTHFRDGVPITGTVQNVTITSTPQVSGNTQFATSAYCVVIEPFTATFYVTARNMNSAHSGASACITASNSAIGGIISAIPMTENDALALDGDACPDGFYTVPYESWCGEGMVNVADVPNCDEYTSGEYCLMAATQPCTSGISALKTSTGLSFPLYAEKHTEPALAVRYNGLVCYANLTVGQSAGAINVKHNGAVYHTGN